MRLSEILRLVWLNLSQNKFKVILTSIGIVVGSATIMLVLAIGTGGKEEVAEQFKNLNAGAIDISCDSSDSGGFSFEMPGGGGSVTVTNMGGGPGGGSGGGTSGGPGGGMDFGGFFGFGQEEESEAVTLTSEDCDDLATFVSGISATTVSYSTTASVEGGDMTSASYYTIAGVEDNYAAISNLEMAIGDFLTEENNESKEKVCVLGNYYYTIDPSLAMSPNIPFRYRLKNREGVVADIVENSRGFYVTAEFDEPEVDMTK